MRYRDARMRIDPAWLMHHFEWQKGSDGVDSLVERKGFVPIPYHSQAHRARRATGSSRRASRFAMRSSTSWSASSRASAYRLSVRVRLPGQDRMAQVINVAYGDSGHYVSRIRFRDGVTDTKLLETIANRLDVELATGKYDCDVRQDDLELATSRRCRGRSCASSSSSGFAGACGGRTIASRFTSGASTPPAWHRTRFARSTISVVCRSWSSRTCASTTRPVSSPSRARRSCASTRRAARRARRRSSATRARTSTSGPRCARDRSPAAGRIRTASSTSRTATDSSPAGLGIHYGAERLGALTVPASGGNTPRQITLMQDLGATVLCCTPSYALNIAETMRDRGIERSVARAGGGRVRRGAVDRRHARGDRARVRSWWRWTSMG